MSYLEIPKGISTGALAIETRVTFLRHHKVDFAAPGIATARLIDQVHAESATQEDGLETFTAMNNVQIADLVSKFLAEKKLD